MLAPALNGSTKGNKQRATALERSSLAPALRSLGFLRKHGVPIHVNDSQLVLPFKHPLEARPEFLHVIALAHDRDDASQLLV